jgi:hypothetical protein
MSAPSAPTTSAPPSLAEMKPCSLLTQSQVAKLGVEASPKPEKVGTAVTCTWHTHQRMLTVAIRTNATLADVRANGGTKSVTTVAGRQAVKQQDNLGCLFALGVGSSGRVDVNGFKRSDAGDLVGDCDLAKQAATLIAPELPKS